MAFNLNLIANMSMEKKMRFKPASFLAVDDLFGGRKTVMVGADGITFWDAIDVERVTPIVIHPIFNPEEVGPLIEYARRNDLLESLRAVVQYINRTQHGRAQRDPLYVMRVLMAYGAGDGSNSALDAAVKKADEEEGKAIQAQMIYERFTSEVERDRAN